MVIAAWAWNLLRDSAAVLLDTTDPHLEAEVRQEVERPGDAKITDLHVWRVGRARTRQSSASRAWRRRTQCASGFMWSMTSLT